MKLKKGIKSLLVCSLLAALLVPSAAFASSYSTTAQIPVTVNVAEGTPTGTKFTVTLTANDPSNPMPEEAQMNAVAKDSKEQDESFDGSFGPITYTTPGDYYYTITQEEGNTKNVTYDTTTYTVMVRVANQDDTSGNDLGLKAVALLWEGAESDKPASDQKLSKAVFDNTYEKDSKPTPTPTPTPTPSKTKTTTTKSVKTGDNSNIFFWTALAVIAAAACVILLIADQKRRKAKR